MDSLVVQLERTDCSSAPAEHERIQLGLGNCKCIRQGHTTAKLSGKITSVEELTQSVEAVNTLYFKNLLVSLVGHLYN